MSSLHGLGISQVSRKGAVDVNVCLVMDGENEFIVYVVSAQ